MADAAFGSGDTNLHRLIGTILREQIDDGALRPGERLPSKEALRQLGRDNFGDALTEAPSDRSSRQPLWTEALLAEPRFAIMLKITPGSAL